MTKVLTHEALAFSYNFLKFTDKAPMIVSTEAPSSGSEVYSAAIRVWDVDRR